MATLAAILDRLAVAREVEAISPQVRTRNENPCSIRAFANEDVFFFTKRIDNSQIVREADPRAGRICWGLIGGSLVGAIALVAIMLPTLYGAFAGYRIEALREETSRLTNERVMLDLEEAKFLNPQHLQELAKKQDFLDPDPAKIIYLNDKPDGAVAERVTPPSKDLAQ
jgi:hypothetical protein